jgi:hypothetical protein
MTTPPDDAVTRAALTELPERQRQLAFDRYQSLRPHLEQDVPLARVAAEASLPMRTAQRWVNLYRRFGLAHLGIRAAAAESSVSSRPSTKCSSAIYPATSARAVLPANPR